MPTFILTAHLPLPQCTHTGPFTKGLTTEGNTVKNQEILAQLEALWLPLKVAIVHCPSHQNGRALKAKGVTGQMQGRKGCTSGVALSVSSDLVVTVPPQLHTDPQYMENDKRDMDKRQGIYRKDQWLHTAEGLIPPRELSKQLTH